MKEKIIVFGIGPFAELLHYYIECESNYQVAAFTVDRRYMQSDNFCELPVLAFDTIETVLMPSRFKMLLAVGYSNMRNRKITFQRAKDKGYQMINYFHPSVNIRNLTCGENNIMMPGSVIEPFVFMGDNNVIWSMTLLGHGLKIGSHNYISAKCLLAGECRIHDLCFIGNGVSMINSLNIQDESFIGAGSTLLKDTQPFSRYYGSPAEFVKSHIDTGIIIR